MKASMGNVEGAIIQCRMQDFASRLVAWQRHHGRHDLPWQRTRDPYRVWLSEVMLQQTRVDAVIPYYGRFLERFPDVAALARASEDEVLRLWSGLGYYARARNLRLAAKAIAKRGGFPRTRDGLAELPGIGRSTAGAIAAFAFGARAAILDGNVRRVLARCFGIEGDKAQWMLADELLPASEIKAYTQGLMDLGASVCTRANPACVRCPVATQCVARREDRISELPSPRKRKPLPLRRATWLVLLHQGSVLLERRPSTGIWGGLWVFPEISGNRALTSCRQNFSVEIAKPRKLPPIEHGFSHFRLQARPILCRVTKVLPRAEAPGRLWLEIDEAAKAAVPIPVRKLLLGLQNLE